MEQIMRHVDAELIDRMRPGLSLDERSHGAFSTMRHDAEHEPGRCGQHGNTGVPDDSGAQIDRLPRSCVDIGDEHVEVHAGRSVVDALHLQNRITHGRMQHRELVMFGMHFAGTAPADAGPEVERRIEYVGGNIDDGVHPQDLHAQPCRLPRGIST